ncbi:MAG: DUF2017 domain-containing protein [Streptosporangiaceae bacterium]
MSGPEDSTGEAGDLVGGFRARRKGGVTARFQAQQAGIIRALVSQVEDLLDDPANPVDAAPGPGGPPDDLAALLGSTGPATPPDDPVLARLLPDAYRGDTEAAGEFRRFTEQDLRSGKLAAARTVLDTLPEQGGRVELSEQDAQVWLRALNDVRLALGVRLDITEDTALRSQDLDPADPRSAYLWVYDWLTYLQETLVRALW